MHMILGSHTADWSDKSQTYLQLYASDMVVTGDGRIYCTTTWEEGARAAGIYKDGDALEDIPGLGVDSGSSVAVTDMLLGYGRKGRIGVFTRGKDGTHDIASGRDITSMATRWRTRWLQKTASLSSWPKTLRVLSD